MGGDGESGGIDDGGAADFLGDLTNKLRSGTEAMLNLSTYYLMKGRAGQVGMGGAFRVLALSLGVFQSHTRRVCIRGRMPRPELGG